MNGVATKQDVVDVVDEHDIEFIKLFFTDILGFLKGLTITRKELEKALDEGMGFDGSSIKGFARIDESDMNAKPDPATFEILPEHLQKDRVGVMFCDVIRPDGTPYEGDPRYVLKRALRKAEEKGYTFYTGPELEFFYFEDDQSTKSLDKGGYFDFIPRDEALEIRRETIKTLEDVGITVEYAHHEVAPSQHEIDLRYTDALQMADQVMMYRYVVKEIAHLNDVYATFMPKPIEGKNGSGMHTHMSLFEGGKNAFFDQNDDYHLSKTARQFTAGILNHARDIAAVTNQWVNSYKRLCPGYEAPVYITWARRNRSDMVRIPGYRPDKEESTRIEFRSPDPACNPYLSFASMLRSGLKGIDEGYDLPSPVEENAYDMTEAERQERDISSLPVNLYEAVTEAKNSELLRDTLGDHVFRSFIENKELEWDDYRKQVTDYEIRELLPVL